MLRNLVFAIVLGLCVGRSVVCTSYRAFYITRLFLGDGINDGVTLVDTLGENIV